MISLGRRNFLAGLGGMLVALPFLEGMQKTVRADGPDNRFFLFFRQWYGVQQKPRFGGVYAKEPEGFWPDAELAPGSSVALTKALLQKTPGGELRATGELAEFADKLLMMRGVRLMDLSVPLHRQNLVQVMTGSHYQTTRPGFTPMDANNAWPIHETLDNRIARSIDGGKPLVFESLMSGSQTSFDNTKDQPRENPTMQQPSAAYASLFTRAHLDARTRDLQVYASDAVSAELKSLRRDPRLSAEDRIRLDRHFEGMNTIEGKLRCTPPSLDDPRMRAIVDADRVKSTDVKLPADQQKRLWQSSSNFNEYAETVADAFIEIAALAAGCGAFRAANLVMPPTTNFDHSTIFPEGSTEHAQGFPGHYHSISHRSFNDTMDNDASLGSAAVQAHHRIDRWHGRKFAKLLGLLRDYGVLDHGITLWSNEIAFGNHWAYDMPYIAAGSAGGKLRTGRLVDLQTREVEAADLGRSDVDTFRIIMEKQTPCSKVLNTIGAALGVKSDDGAPLHDFGGYQRDHEQKPTARALGNLPSLLA